MVVAAHATAWLASAVAHRTACDAITAVYATGASAALWLIKLRMPSSWRLITLRTSLSPKLMTPHGLPVLWSICCLRRHRRSSCHRLAYQRCGSPRCLRCRRRSPCHRRLASFVAQRAACVTIAAAAHVACVTIAAASAISLLASAISSLTACGVLAAAHASSGLPALGLIASPWGEWPLWPRWRAWRPSFWKEWPYTTAARVAAIALWGGSDLSRHVGTRGGHLPSGGSGLSRHVGTRGGQRPLEGMAFLAWLTCRHFRHWVLGCGAYRVCKYARRLWK